MNGLRKRSKQNERLKSICLAIESFLDECEPLLPVRNGEEIMNIFEEEEDPMDDNFEWWTVYEINNDDRFPRFLRTANRFYKYGVVSDTEVREAADRMAATGVLDIYKYSIGTKKYFQLIKKPVQEPVPEIFTGPENAPWRFVVYVIRPFRDEFVEESDNEI